MMTTTQVQSPSMLQRVLRLVLIGLVLYLAYQTAKSVTRLFAPPQPLAELSPAAAQPDQLQQLTAAGYWVFPDVRWKFGNFPLDDKSLRQRIEKTAHGLRNADSRSVSQQPDAIEQAALRFLGQAGTSQQNLSETLTLHESPGLLRIKALVIRETAPLQQPVAEVEVTANHWPGGSAEALRGKLAALWICVTRGQQQLVVELLPTTAAEAAAPHLLPLRGEVTRLLSRWSEANELQLEQVICTQKWDELVAEWNKAGWQAEPLPPGSDPELHALFRQNQQLILVYRLQDQGKLKLLVSRANP